jgi:hypothetical protein
MTETMTTNDAERATCELTPEIRKLADWYEQQTGFTVSPQTTGRLYRIKDWLERHELTAKRAQLVVSASDRWGRARQRSERVREISEKVGATKHAGGRTLHIWIAPVETAAKRRSA